MFYAFSSVFRNNVKLKNVIFFPFYRCMLGGTMTMANRAMAQPQLTESPPWCRAWRARRSLEWLVGPHIVQPGRQWTQPRPLSTNLSSSRRQETRWVLPTQVTSSCRLRGCIVRVVLLTKAVLCWPAGWPSHLLNAQLLSSFICADDLPVLCFVHLDGCLS